MQTVTKTIISTVMLSVSLVLASDVEARLKYYRYNANIPMVEMSLNMMVAMGVLEQIPGRLVHDGNPYNRSVTARHGRYSRHSYDYPLKTRYSDDYLYDDYWGGPISPYSRYSDELYGYSSYPRYRSYGSRWDSPWDSPWGSRWGNRWDDPRYGGWGNQLYSPWGNAWKYQWMNPWSSPWSDTLVNPYSGLYGNPGGWPLTPGYQGLPSSPDSMLGDNQSGNDSSNSGGPALNQPGNKNGYSVDEISWSGYPSNTDYRRSAYAANSRSTHQGINGLWIGESGEMLGIRGNNFLWYDGSEQYAIGDLLKSPTMMQASADGSSKVFRFHYKLMGNQLVTISKSGKIRTYNRMLLRQPHQFKTRPQAAYSSYKPEQHASRTSYSKYRTDYYGPGTAAALNSYPGNASASARTNSLANSRRYGSAIAADLYSRESPYLHQPAVSSTDHRLQQDSSPALKLTSKGNLNDATAFSYSDVNTVAVPEVTADSADVASLWNTYSPESNHARYAKSSTTGSLKDLPYEQAPVRSQPYHNADRSGPVVTDISTGGDAGRNLQPPYATFGAYPDFPAAAYPGYDDYNTATVIPGSSTVSGSLLPSVAHTEGKSYLNRREKYKADELNPDTYLYSYMKDQNNMRATAALDATDNFNIWKPNQSFGQRHLDSGTQQSTGSGQNAEPGNTEVRKFVWSDSAAWN